MSSTIINRALPEMKADYTELRKLHDEAWRRKYHNEQNEFDDKFLHMANKLIQTLGYLIDSVDE